MKTIDTDRYDFGDRKLSLVCKYDRNSAFTLPLNFVYLFYAGITHSTRDNIVHYFLIDATGE
jgi:hypothetical protein